MRPATWEFIFWYCWLCSDKPERGTDIRKHTDMKRTFWLHKRRWMFECKGFARSLFVEGRLRPYVCGVSGGRSVLGAGFCPGISVTFFLVSFQHHYPAAAYQPWEGLSFFSTLIFLPFCWVFGSRLAVRNTTLVKPSVIQSSQSSFGRPVGLWPLDSADRCHLCPYDVPKPTVIFIPLMLRINKPVIHSTDILARWRPRFRVDIVSPQRNRTKKVNLGQIKYGVGDFI
jgi:hypothetical protein